MKGKKGSMKHEPPATGRMCLSPNESRIVRCLRDCRGYAMVTPRHNLGSRQSYIALIAAILLIVQIAASSSRCDPIHDAAREGDLATVQSLLTKNRHLALDRDKSGKSPLHYAALYGHANIAELLLSKGAKIDGMDHQGMTPLHLAAMAGQTLMAQFLIAHSADVNAKARSDWTPLHIAALWGKRDVAELLIAGKADIAARDSDGRTPLHLAAWKGRTGMLDLLIKSQADIGAKDSYGMTALHWTALGGSNLHIYEEYSGRTLEAVLYVPKSDSEVPQPAQFSGYKAAAEMLLANKASVNTSDEYHMTPLHLTALTGTNDVALVLLANHARVDSKNTTGWTPLHFAVLYDCEKVAESLLAGGADVNNRTNRNRPIELFPRLDYLYDEHRTPLHIAARWGSKDMMELLLAHHAEVNATDDKGKTPLAIAIKNGRTEVADILRQSGAREYV